MFLALSNKLWTPGFLLVDATFKALVEANIREHNRKDDGMVAVGKWMANNTICE
jgi:hypothetical protein